MYPSTSLGRPTAAPPPPPPTVRSSSSSASPEWTRVCQEYNLPVHVADCYAKIGIKTLYPWQLDCLRTTHALNDAGKNLVYCAPTGGGKTLISELIMLKTCLVMGRKAVFVLPFVSLVLEKERYWKKLLFYLNRSRSKGTTLRAKGFYGDQNIMTAGKYDVIICTIEKANTLINNFVLNGRIDRIGCIVLDEMHALGESFNGYLLEILVSKVLFLEARAKEFLLQQYQGSRSHYNGSAMTNGHGLATSLPAAFARVRIQIVAMSATVGNKSIQIHIIPIILDRSETVVKTLNLLVINQGQDLAFYFYKPLTEPTWSR